MRINPVADKDKWNYLKTIALGNNAMYRIYGICETRTLTLYGYAYDNDVLIHSAELNDYNIEVFSILVVKIVDGKEEGTMQFLTGNTSVTLSTAMHLIERNYSRTVKFMEKIEDILEDGNIPYIKDFNTEARNFIKKRFRALVPAVKKVAFKKGFTIKVVSDDPEVKRLIEESQRMMLKYVREIKAKGIERAEKAIKENTQIFDKV